MQLRFRVRVLFRNCAQCKMKAASKLSITWEHDVGEPMQSLSYKVCAAAAFQVLSASNFQFILYLPMMLNDIAKWSFEHPLHQHF